MEDLEIVELYWNRNEDAIKQTSDKYGNYCYSIANNILNNNEDSQECVNDTYLAAWNAIPPHHPLILSTFLGKITRRLSLNKWRSLRAEKRGGKQVTLSYDELEACITTSDGNKDIDDRLLADSIDVFLSNISEDNRKIFVCRYWYFDSINEIALRFKFSPSKVKMSLKRSREKLKEHLYKEGFYDE